MRNLLYILGFCLGTSLCQSAIIPFDISPPGTDNAEGLHADNEVGPLVDPPFDVVGDEVGAGISLDTSTMTLSFTFAYGSDNGFDDLTDVISNAHIHGPAPVGVNGPVVFDLMPFLTTSTDGGLFIGSIGMTAGQMNDLQNNMYYINLHTPQNPSGEVRGQLIAAIPEPSSSVYLGLSLLWLFGVRRILGSDS